LERAGVRPKQSLSDLPSEALAKDGGRVKKRWLKAKGIKHEKLKKEILCVNSGFSAPLR
jgi:hypothetical protein